MTELINRYELDSDSETDVESNIETNDSETDVESNSEKNNSEMNNTEPDENIFRLNPDIKSDPEIRQDSSESPESPDSSESLGSPESEFYMFESDGFLQTRDDVIHTAFISAIVICGILTIWATTVNNLTLAIVSLVIMTVIMLGGLIKFIIKKFSFL